MKSKLEEAFMEGRGIETSDYLLLALLKKLGFLIDTHEKNFSLLFQMIENSDKNLESKIKSYGPRLIPSPS